MFRLLGEAFEVGGAPARRGSRTWMGCCGLERPARRTRCSRTRKAGHRLAAGQPGVHVGAGGRRYTSDCPLPARSAISGPAGARVAGRAPPARESRSCPSAGLLGFGANRPAAQLGDRSARRRARGRPRSVTTSSWTAVPVEVRVARRRFCRPSRCAWDSRGECRVGERVPARDGVDARERDPLPADLQLHGELVLEGVRLTRCERGAAGVRGTT